MTTKRDIDEQIQKEYNIFYTAVYDGSIAVPSDLTQRFRKALMAIAPNLHQIHANRMRELIDKPANELTWVQVGAVINVSQAVPFRDVYDDLDEAIEKTQRLEILRVGYNSTVAALDKKMATKKKKLQELAGISPTGTTRLN